MEEKSELEKSIEVMQEAERQFQKILDSPISQYFHDSYSVPLLQNDQPSVLDMSIELLCMSEQQSQNILDSKSINFSKIKIPTLLF